MKTCKDCINFDMCSENAYIEALRSEKTAEYIIIISNKIACKHFKDKANIVELPCNVGDTVYRIVDFYNKNESKIIEGEIFKYAITHEHFNTIKYRFYFSANGETFVRRNYSLWCDFDNFGNTVFRTREEAEQKIKERKTKCKPILF